MAPMIDIQLLNDALLTLAFTVGLAIALSAAIVTSAALWRRHEQKTGVREIEQHLAVAGTEHSSAAAG
jgi:cytochrome c biogenesis protein CcdA